MNNVADELVKTLKENGVRFIFGIPSVHNIPVYEALRKESGIRHILCRQETTACHIADGYARALWCERQVSPVPSVVLASTGPGTCYLVPAVQEAYESSSPILIITTNIQHENIGKRTGALHEVVDQDSIFANITKKTICVRNADNIRSDTEKALTLAADGRTGPVYLEIPTDLFKKTIKSKKEKISTAPPNSKNSNDIDEALRLVHNAKRPILIVGNAALRSGLSGDVETLAKKLCAPVITTTQSKGVISENSELSFGNAAQKGIVQEMAENSDLAIAVGTRLREVDGKRRGLKLPKLIHIDWEDSWVGRNFPADVALIGDMGYILNEIIMRIESSSVNDKKVWIENLNRKKKEEIEAINENQIEMQYINAIREVMPQNGILVIDNTQLGYWCEFFYPSYRPGGIIAARGSSPIGFSFPAAVGAKIARPEENVVALIGDGGFLYCEQELATCIRYNIGFPVIVVNDNAFGVISYLQEKDYGQKYESNLTNPDFNGIAKAFGVNAARVETPSQLRDALQKSLVSKKMWIIELQATFPLPAFAKY